MYRLSACTYLFLLYMISVLRVADNQTILQDFFTSTSEPLIDIDNITAISLDLDEILAAVNKTTVEASSPTPVSASYGDRVFMHAINNNYNVNDLRGRTLRIVVPKIEPPYVNYVNFTDAEKIARGYGPGVVIEILKEIQKNLNLTYILIEATDQQWGAFEKGNWTGAFGMMYRGDADILAGAAIMQYDRGLITDLTFPFQYAPTAMLIRSPEKFNDNTWLIVTQPFKWEVWGLCAISIAVSGVILFIFTRFLSGANEVQYTFVDSVWVFFSVFVQQGLPVQPRSWACRVMLALWWLASITLMATFTGSLVALFAVDKTNMPFTTFNQLVKLVQKGKWQIIMDGTSITRTNMIRESESPTYTTLWYEMSVNRKVTYVKGVETGIALLLTQQNMVLLGPEDTLKFQATIDCQLRKLDEGILPTYLSIPLAKDSDFSTYFSTTIRDLVERGFIDKWINDYTNYMASKKSNAKCNTTTTASEKYLDLSKAQGAFWVLIAGFCLSIIFLAVEFSYRACRTTFWALRSSGRLSTNSGSVRDQPKHVAFSSKTTSSLSSGSTGGEPEIIKLDSRQLENIERQAVAAMGEASEVRYEGTKF